MKISEHLHGFLWNDPRVNNCNTYLIDGPPRILIDPGHSHLFGNVENQLARLKLRPEDMDIVLATHAHPDHLESLRFFKTPTLIALGQTEQAFMKEMIRQRGRAMGGNEFEPDFFLQEGTFRAGGLDLEILLCPGHSPGSLCLYWPDQKALFTGDVIFNQGLGRTDLPGGDGELLKLSIRRLAALEVETLLPGHGELVVGKENVQANFKAVEEYWFNYI
jgi:hydroxyacylglutathione hydrolase